MSGFEKARYYAMGYHGARGVLVHLSKLVLVFALLFYAYSYLFPPSIDDTDASADKRSGVKLITDYGTGCQYLATIAGSLYPRMGTDGKQVCTGEKK